MAIWRSATLEALVGGPLDADGLDAAFLQSLVADGASEGEQLDFKAELPASGGQQQQSWTPAQEFAKDVAAFANARGGLLIYGVEDSSGIATGLRPISGVTFEAEERRLRQALANTQAPLATVDIINIATSVGFCVAIVIPPSPKAPHAVLTPGNSRKPVCYPARHGADTIYLTESEVAERYHRRFQAMSDLASRVQERTERGQEALQRSTGYWAYVAVAPELPSVSQLDRNLIDEIHAWHASNTLTTPLQRYLGAFGAPIPIPGGVSFTGSAGRDTEDETLPQDAYIELHVDGSVFAAKRIADHVAAPAAVQGLTLSQDIILLVDKALRWTTERVGGGGQATLTVGIYDANRSGFNDWEGGLALLNDSGHRHARTRLLEREPRTDLAVDLGHASTQQGRLAVAYSALSSLLQWFGVAETELLTREGVLRVRNWAVGYTEVQQRAAEWDLPTTLDS